MKHFLSFQFLNLRQSVGLLGRGSARRGGRKVKICMSVSGSFRNTAANTLHEDGFRRRHLFVHLGPKHKKEING
jgi:hypothetical protein